MLVIIAILIENKRVKRIVIDFHRSTCRTLLVDYLVLSYRVLIACILVGFVLLGDTLVGTMGFMTLLTVDFLLGLYRFRIVMNVLAHEHLACKNIINKSL